LFLFFIYFLFFFQIERRRIMKKIFSISLPLLNGGGIVELGDDLLLLEDSSLSFASVARLLPFALAG